MPVVINTNVSSLNAQRTFSQNTTGLQKTMERLSSGYRINRAGDDAAGLQLSERLRTQILGSKKALDNAQDAINVMNIADGSMGVIGDNLQRVRELLVQGANDTYDAVQRGAIEDEITARLADISRIAEATSFNGTDLLDGTFGGAGTNFFIQVGSDSTTGVDDININTAFANLRADGAAINLATGAGNTVDVTSHATIQASIGRVDTAINNVNDRRANLGAFVNQMESAVDNLQVSNENLSAAESRIRDADIATESSQLIRYQILQQASSTILAQANQAPSVALQLLQG